MSTELNADGGPNTIVFDSASGYSVVASYADATRPRHSRYNGHGHSHHSHHHHYHHSIIGTQLEQPAFRL